ncbi:MAG: helix-turn-helix domain-containing protein [Elusimicrobiales bacterium]|nr:helix-turn-helix domain-containing protein [Elusimicrobiales bacterium]
MTMPPQKLPEQVPAQLKERRQSRGLTLETVHRRTRIPVAALEALEVNNPAWFSAPVYMHGFLRQYCEYLELDCDALLAPERPAPLEVAPPAPPQPPRQLPAERFVAWAEKAGASAQEDFFADGKEEPRPETRQRHIFREGEALGHEDFGTSLNGGLARYMALTCLAFSLATAWLWRSAGVSAQNERTGRRAQYDQLYEATFVSTLKAAFERRAWLRVDTDGETAFEGYAPAGTVREWKASRNFAVSFAPPGAVAVTLDNKLIKPEVFSSSHTVIPVTFTGFAL